jgi:NitT/TauT family transport system substrate-binding protein
MRTRAKTLLVLAASVLLGLASAQPLPKVNAAMEAVGTFSWIVHAMNTFGIDARNGIEVVGTTYANKQATEIALRGGDADVTVDDFLGSIILRSNGVAATAIYPFAKAVGGLVVPTDGEVASIGDLRGRTLAAGSLRDKSLLILRALAISQYGFDPQVDGEVIAAAAPLMQQLIADGQVDAGLPLWHFVARIEGAGLGREIMPVTAMLDELGLPSDLPILMILARDDFDADLKRAFLTAFVETVEVMNGLPAEDPFWQSILDLGLYSLPNAALFPAVVERWKFGTPDSWTEESVDAMVAMSQRLLDIGGPEVLGVDAIPRDAYTTAFNPR